MAAHDVAQFVREHALHLFGGVGRLDQPAEDIDVLAAGDKGVDAAVAEQVDAHLPGLETRRDEQRVHHVLKQHLGLGIAQDRLRHRGAHRHGKHREQGQQDTENGARPWRPGHRLRRESGHPRLSCAARLNPE